MPAQRKLKRSVQHTTKRSAVFNIARMFYLFFCLFILYFRVLELKLLPPLVLWGLYFFTSFFMLVLFNLIFFGEAYYTRFIYCIISVVFSATSYITWTNISSYVLIFFGSLFLITSKIYLTVGMVVGNIIDVYILSLIAVIITSMITIFMHGLIVLSMFLLFFLSTSWFILCILGLLEVFSLLFSSITMSNRLSVNMLCGSLILSLIVRLVSASIGSSPFQLTCFNIGVGTLLLACLLILIFMFELFNSIVQCAIFNVLGLEYLAL